MHNELQALNHVAKVNMTAGSFEIDGYDELKQAIEQEVAKYDGLVIAFDDKATIKSGKDSRAELNKVSKLIDDFRKNYKKRYNEPLAEFENKMNALKLVVDETTNKIKKALDEVEVRFQENKRKQIQLWIDELSEGYPVIFNDKWLNATAKELDIRAAIIEQVDNVKEQVRIQEENEKIVRTFAEDLGQNADAWVSMLDYETPMSIVEKMKAAKKREEEKQKAHDELQKRNEAVFSEIERPTVDNVVKTPSEKYAEFLFGEFMPEEEQEVTQTYTVTLMLTTSQKEQLEKFCKLADITLQFKDNVDLKYDVDELPW